MNHFRFKIGDANNLSGMIAVTIESYLFPFLFLYSIYNHSLFLWMNSNQYPLVWRRLITGTADIQAVIFISALLAKLFLILLNSLIIFGFLIRRNLYKKPEGFLEIFIPLLGSFFYLLYSYIQLIPGKFNPLLLPENLLLFSVLLGTLLNLFGAIISSVATFNLRHSYSLFVEVRDIITEGLYRHVRHPIYFGYILSTLGFCFILPKPIYIIIFLMSIGITLFRADLEERKLLANSSDYQEYAKKTPFIFPWQRRQ